MKGKVCYYGFPDKIDISISDQHMLHGIFRQDLIQEYWDMARLRFWGTKS